MIVAKVRWLEVPEARTMKLTCERIIGRVVVGHGMINEFQLTSV